MSLKWLIAIMAILFVMTPALNNSNQISDQKTVIEVAEGVIFLENQYNELMNNQYINKLNQKPNNYTNEEYSKFMIKKYKELKDKKHNDYINGKWGIVIY